VNSPNLAITAFYEVRVAPIPHPRRSGRLAALLDHYQVQTNGETDNPMSTKLMRSGPARVFNSLVLLFAGTRFFPLYGVIEHRGRRSGRIFHTPVVVRPVADGFVVPMPWGERTD
jgi:hypothetical protein